MEEKKGIELMSMMFLIMAATIIDSCDNKTKQHCSRHNNGEDCDFGEEEVVHSYEEKGIKRLN